MKDCLIAIGQFLLEQGYLWGHFSYSLDLDVVHTDGHIQQIETDVISSLKNQGIVRAIYEMGYPVVLPSTVYLYHSIGKAQHHSSRMMEELFALIRTPDQ